METPSELLAKKFQGRINAGESTILQSWIDESDDNKSVYEQAEQMWFELGFADSEFSADKQAAWEMLSGDLKPIVEEEQSSIKRQIIRLALIIIGLFAIAGIASLVLSFNANIVHTATERGEKMVLPDSSVAYLDSGTVIKYSKRFGTKNRTMSIEGEAIVESIRMDGMPFTVRTKHGKILFNGASVDISSNAIGLGVIALSGNAKLSLIGRTYDLQPLTMASLDSSTTPVILPADLNLIAWKSNQIVLANAPFGKLIRPIEKAVHRKLVFSTAVDYAKLITIDLNPVSVQSVADSLSKRLMLNHRIEKERIVFY